MGYSFYNNNALEVIFTLIVIFFILGILLDAFE